MRLRLGVPLPGDLFSSLGITARQDYNPELVESVQPVVILGDFSDSISGIHEALTSSLAGSKFVWSVNGAASVGNFTHIQLKNPAGSNKTVLVDSMCFQNYNAAAVIYALHRYDTDLTAPVPTSNPRNMETGALDGVCQSRLQTPAALLPNQSWLTIPLAAGICFQINFAQPFVIADGQGMVLVAAAANQAVGMTAFIREVAE